MTHTPRQYGQTYITLFILASITIVGLAILLSGIGVVAYTAFVNDTATQSSQPSQPDVDLTATNNSVSLTATNLSPSQSITVTRDDTAGQRVIMKNGSQTVFTDVEPRTRITATYNDTVIATATTPRQPTPSASLSIENSNHTAHVTARATNLSTTNTLSITASGDSITTAHNPQPNTTLTASISTNTTVRVVTGNDDVLAQESVSVTPPEETEGNENNDDDASTDTDSSDNEDSSTSDETTDDSSTDTTNNDTDSTTDDSSGSDDDSSTDNTSSEDDSTNSSSKQDYGTYDVSISGERRTDSPNNIITLTASAPDAPSEATIRWNTDGDPSYEHSGDSLRVDSPDVGTQTVNADVVIDGDQHGSDTHRVYHPELRSRSSYEVKHDVVIDVETRDRTHTVTVETDGARLKWPIQDGATVSSVEAGDGTPIDYSVSDGYVTAEEGAQETVVTFEKNAATSTYDDVFVSRFVFAGQENKGTEVTVRVENGDLLNAHRSTDHSLSVNGDTARFSDGTGAFNGAVVVSGTAPDANHNGVAVYGSSNTEPVKGARSVVEDTLGVTTQSDTIPVVVHDVEKRDVGGYYRNGLVHIDDGVWERGSSAKPLVAHELSHAVTSSVMPMSPRWFNEGSAQVVEAAMHDQQGTSMDTPFVNRQERLTTFHNNGGDVTSLNWQHDRRLAYDYSYLYVRSMAQDDRLADVYGELALDNSYRLSTSEAMAAGGKQQQTMCTTQVESCVDAVWGTPVYNDEKQVLRLNGDDVEVAG